MLGQARRLRPPLQVRKDAKLSLAPPYIPTYSLLKISRVLQSRASSGKGAKLAQKLGQLQPLVAALPQECMRQLGSFGPT